MPALTSRQAKLLAFIKAYSDEHGCGPSYEEMAKHLGLKSKGNVFYLVRGLRERGAIDDIPGQPRSVAVAIPSDKREIAELRARVDALTARFDAVFGPLAGAL